LRPLFRDHRESFDLDQVLRSYEGDDLRECTRGVRLRQKLGKYGAYFREALHIRNENCHLVDIHHCTADVGKYVPQVGQNLSRL